MYGRSFTFYDPQRKWRVFGISRTFVYFREVVLSGIFCLGKAEDEKEKVEDC
jgi:hypothetical protein